MTGKNLADEMKSIRDGASERSRRLYDTLVQHLQETGALSGALKPGDTFPDFQLVSAEGNFVTRADILAKGPAVVAFDRGAWCPYCTAVLGALDKVAPAIAAAGARLIAITPEAGGAALRTKVARGLNLELLCDLDSLLALECGLVYKVSDDLRQAYLDRGIDLERIYGNTSWMLPAPATFVVRKDGTIAYTNVAADFRFREDPGEILKQLQALR
jgi:peroxiredoxin